ncbi:hypothetical protein KK062_06220 [Fulvivirgaceae bacterium PWU5]|uniref:Lipoprotein n=1 Tax=Dawidia cretensis TaxID=2782350 RepID=A0AAP2DUU0_9BACT|nr:hypothetical protein [Dawidia cretensis]MBT1707806.1 hypothetical protein [Dawidia cretensis]
MRVFLLLITILFGVSCKNRNESIDLVEYQDGKQLLTMDKLERNGREFIIPKIHRLSKDSVLVGNELLVKIFLGRNDLDLVNAFLDCDSTVVNPTVDTTTYRISGCSRGLIVQNDTILIGFHPTKPGVQRFSEITILTKDRKKVFRTLKYSFEYKVVAKQ